ncbi:(2Fe-2S)-binding protein [Bacillus sp. B1-b2]|uniref:(2Fe-2S)-binding protein n=1 Tax=Bacillus sp. B1-b2 TaxID=2653201 RepID=UPI001261C696|nr:(2Fe-2S)-binding protein [Bacillus sp. B1-b2]KAB7664320.1 (2Fe-2S)-binding protein [Bacillus sp. B1-b2]
MTVEPTNLVIVELTVNGENHTLVIPPNKTLLTSIREDLYLTGAKPGCYNGDCGACTVLIENVPMKSCLMLTVEANKKDIQTIEGLHNSAIQKAFIENFAFQCGYCTPGFILNSHALLQQHPNPSRETIKEWLESNICRCTSYEEIEQAIGEVIQEIMQRKRDAE